jgi:glycosyltransferase involved in cell wall biosynthesis
MNPSSTVGIPSATGRLRVGHVVLGLRIGGLERVVVDLINHAAEDLDPLVICLEEKGELATEIRRKDVPVLVLKRRPGFRPWLAFRVGGALRRHGVDLVHTHNSAAGFYGALAGRLSRVPVLHTKHGANTAGTRAQKTLNRLSFTMTDHVVAVSEPARALALQEGVRKERLSVIDNGIDVESFAPDPARRVRARASLDVPAEAFVVGTVARLVAVKNQALLLDAFSDLAAEATGRPEPFLVLIGDGPERERLAQRARGMRGGERVVFAGSRRHLEELLPAIDVFALSSDSEGLPVALLEAMAASIPSVVTRVGAMPQVVTDGVGVVIDRGARGDLTRALGTLREDEDLRRRLGEAGRRRICDQYAASTMARAYEALYERLVGHGSIAA